MTYRPSSYLQLADGQLLKLHRQLSIKLAKMANCPCCSDKLLRHIKGSSIYWFCRSCWQEMPVFESKVKQAESTIMYPLPKITGLSSFKHRN
jgi:ribosomal protein L37AE/L43A